MGPGGRTGYLLGEFGDGQGTVSGGILGGEGSEARHEEVEAGEGHHVDGQLTEIGVELTGEPETGGHSGHGHGD